MATPAADSSPLMAIPAADSSLAADSVVEFLSKPITVHNNLEGHISQVCRLLHHADASPATDASPTADSSHATDMAHFYVDQLLYHTVTLLELLKADASPAADAAPAMSPSLPPEKSELTAEEKYLLVRSIGELCTEEDELKNLMAKKSNPIAYDGFVPTGKVHVAQGIMKVINVNKLVAAGCTVKILIADSFAERNKEIGGDMRKIQTVGKYFIEICRAAGMHLANVQFLWSSEHDNDPMYWRLVTAIAKANKVSNIVRTSENMDCKDTDESAAAQVVYPCMQCADVFFLEADICQLGMNDKKVNVLATEYCNTIKRKNKPVILSHSMVPELLQKKGKMLQYKASSSIYMEDRETEVSSKINKAYCPEKIVEGNPCLEYLKHIVFPWFGKIEVVRRPGSGGNKEYSCFEVLAEDYASGGLHPGDLKPALAKAINEILQPVRNHFETDSAAKELLKAVKSYKVA